MKRGGVCVGGGGEKSTCLIALLAMSFSSTPPTKTCTVRFCTNWLAMAFTSRGQVAEKKRVCLCGGMLRTIFWICRSHAL